MPDERINRIAVVGAGTMGHAIGQTFAQAGYAVVLHDLVADRLQRARDRIERNLSEMVALRVIPSEQIGLTLGRIELNTSLSDAVGDADLVLESVFEDRALKRDVFGKLDRLCRAPTILASNTSEIVPSTFAAATGRPDRVVTAHYFYPAHLVPLVEVVPCPETSADTIATVSAVLKASGKTPVVMRKEAPGFIANRLQVALLREAVHMVERGIATPEEINQVITLSFGRRMGTLGLFK